MLTRVAQTLRDRGQMTAAELAQRIGSDEAAVRGMLDVWSRKGKVVTERLACGGCTACGVSNGQYYRWDDGGPSGCVLGAADHGVRRSAGE